MGKKILLADDHGVVRLGLSLIIKKLRPDSIVTEVDDYQKVMNIIKDQSFDLVILDLNMPNGNFQEALQAIKLKNPQTKVMIFSSQDESLYAIRYLKMGADGFLHKLADEDIINRALTKMLDKGSYMSEDVKESLIFSNLRNDDNTIINPLEKLTNREMEVAERLIAGEPMKEISNNLNLHASTISTYKTRIFEKLDIQSIPELIKIFDFYEISKE
ncbi:MAG TPA: response regulator transcription factor [Chitinophagales bacterium]|nr:response regulator transcription factor [Chitinophagales bacterium]